MQLIEKYHTLGRCKTNEENELAVEFKHLYYGFW